MITYPRNFGEVRIGLVTVTSDTPAGVDFSDPTVTTQAVTNMSLVSATLNGYLANLGTSSSVEVSFEWGTTTDYGFDTPPQSMLGPGSFSFDLAPHRGNDLSFQSQGHRGRNIPGQRYGLSPSRPCDLWSPPATPAV